MKKIFYVAALVVMAMLTGCNEDSWLEEVPKDFYTADNSYITTTQFNEALNGLYDNVRKRYWQMGDAYVTLYMGDIAFGGTDFPDLKFNNVSTYWTPETGVPSSYWTDSYVPIANANVILSRLESAESVSDEDKARIRGEALFFRAFYYRFLANLFGGVPLVLDEASNARRDFVRATREEVYQQIVKDLEESVSLLDDIENVPDGRINKQASQHLLSEAYISLGEYDKAVQAASAVINHNGMALMTERFGSRKDDAEGNPYWDLFQLDNQNRSTSGNTETVLALQYEYENTGSSYGCAFPRNILPAYQSAVVEGANGDQVVAFSTWTSEKGGRGIGVIHPTYYFLNQVWGDDFDNDYRNSSKLIIRDIKIDNPKAKGYGQWLVKDGWIRSADTLRNFYPMVEKFSRVGYFPENSYAKNADGSYKLTALGEHCLLNVNNSANYSFKDEYLFRLAGTYLLRAEAYLGIGNKEKAAEDINKLRKRANASLVSASDVNIDLILDESMRELYFEDFRVQTLCRLGKFVERSHKYNPTGYNVKDNQNLLPIPYSEIERNIFGEITQNPGY